MQKKIIALAVAGLVSGVAFAQSNVTVYGIADMAYQYSSKTTVEGTKSLGALNDGGQDGSRFGFKGTEDLGNGLSANFNLEMALPLDTTTSTIAGRNSYVGLSSKSWGEVKLGSMGSVHDDINGFGEAGGMGWGNGAIAMLNTGDYGNGIKYISPSFSGLTVTLAASTNVPRAVEQEPLGAVTNTPGYGGNVAYVNGGLKLAASYDRQKGTSTNTNTFDKTTEWLLAGSYNFGMFTVGGNYDQTKWDNSASEKRAAWRFNIGAAITPNDSVALSYSHVKFSDNTDSAKAKGVGVSYSHVLSKRTNVYATYGQTSRDEVLDGEKILDGAGFYDRAFKVGVRHFF